MYAIRLSIIFLLTLTAFTGSTFASETNGTIESGNASARICKDASCATYGSVNWKPTGSTAVAITDSGLTGYIWGNEIGWGNLAPTGSGVTINTTTGALSGYAYANTGSWINFNPTDISGGTDVGVTINSSGQFVGWAWVSGVYGGWMKFDCALAATCVKTDWRPTGSRTTTPSGGGGGGGGGSGGGTPSSPTPSGTTTSPMNEASPSPELSVPTPESKTPSFIPTTNHSTQDSLWWLWIIVVASLVVWLYAKRKQKI
jgi:hypothetical protein